MSTAGFRERARQEAERYGADPWVFVRELLQNARDAGAEMVLLSAERRDGRDRFTCRDDGCGMSLEHARRFLFTLYASSKRRGQGEAGRFGVGFWSVLRFDPDTITVRSRPAEGAGWEVVLDGGLGAVEPSSCVMYQGTEVVLERAARGSHPLPMVLEAAHRDARYLRPRDDEGRPLEVTVNGRRITEELTLPAPSLTFRRPGLRGAVALGGEARVDVLSHGLRVRSAPFLDELLLDAQAAPASVELAEGLLPRVVLDSDRLEVLLARGDVGDSATLRRAVAVAHTALRRLVRSELDRSAPLHGPRRWLERARELRPHGRVAPLLAAALGGAALGVAVAIVVAGRSGPVPAPADLSPASRPATKVVAGVEHPLLYRDLAAAYSGPTVDALDDSREVALSYLPASETPWLAALRLTGTGDGHPSAALPTGPYQGAPCATECLDVTVQIDAPAGPLRLPLATGHLLDPASVRLDGVPVDVAVSPTGEPVLFLATAQRGQLHYRSSPGPDPQASVAATWPALPAGLAGDAARLRRLPPAARVEAAARLVASRVRYDRSPEVAERHRAAIAAGAGALERALVIGAGDCDVQNFVLAAVLAATGLQSRMAVGFVGRGGRAAGGVHAWVEVLQDGRWSVADASTVLPAAPLTAENEPRAAEETAAPRPRRAAGGEAARSRAVMWIGVIGGLAALASLGWLGVARKGRAGRGERALPSAGDGDLAPLLRAALLRPRAWSRMEAVYGRPLVPTLGRGPLSLRRALRLARRGRLYRATVSSDMVRRAVGRQGAVVDAGSPEGRAVADLLGVPDLDQWQGVLERASREEVVARMEAALRGVGLEVRLCVVPEAPAAVAVITGGPFGFGRRSLVAVVDAGSRLWSVVAAAADERPEWAALVLGDEIVERAPGPFPDGGRCRGELARRALEGAEA